jgi:hypothetical protein
MTHMGLLSLSELQPGMVLAMPLFNDSGIMLLPRGTRLTDKHLGQLKHWGVREATVEGLGRQALSADEAAQLHPDLLAAIDRALDEKFALGDADEIMAEVKRIVRKMAVEEAISRKRELSEK